MFLIFRQAIFLSDYICTLTAKDSRTLTFYYIAINTAAKNTTKPCSLIHPICPQTSECLERMLVTFYVITEVPQQEGIQAKGDRSDER